MSCGLPPADAPRISLVLVAAGEPRLRLERRLQCAASGLGLRLDRDIQKDPEAVGLRFENTPAVLRDNHILFTGLLRTEEIEARLRTVFTECTQRTDVDVS